MPYTALILSAGYGNRMKPFTLDKHKSLLEVSGKTILGMIIESLISYGVKNFCIVTGYKAKDIVDYVSKNYRNINVDYVHNKDFYKTNNIFSVSLALNKLKTEDDILLIESDLIFKKEILKSLFNSKYKNAALVSKYVLGMDGTVIDKDQDKVIAVYPPHLHGKEFNFKNKYKTLNIYKFANKFVFGEFKKMLSFYASNIDSSCYYELILGLLIYMNREEIYAIEVDSYSWAEVDDPNDLSVAEYIFNIDNRKKILENSHGGYWNYPVEDFTYIRNFYYPTSSMISSMKRYLDKLIFNYGSSQEILNRKIALLEGFDMKFTIALSGAAQIYPIMRNYFGDKKIALPDITFGEYSRFFENTNLYNDLFDNNYDLESAINLSDLICIVNPNNPTGKIYSSEFIYKNAKNNLNKIFIIDESFIDYSDENSIINFLNDDALDNVIVIKSLSKAHGVPGLRLGYIFTRNKELYDYIIKNIPIWNMNSIAEYFLEISLKYKSDLKKSFVSAKKDRDYLIQRLNEISFIDNVFESHASFVTFLVKNKYWSESLSEYLLKTHNIYLKELSRVKEVNSKYFRVALTNVKNIDYFIDSLKMYSIFKNKVFK